MCTLSVFVGRFDSHPLVVAANRDERLGRASSGPRVWEGTPRLVAPVDDVAGGTWWAIAESGLFVGLTNRAGANLDPGRRSRGLLVVDVARTGTLAAAESYVRSLRAEDYNGFHLLASDGRGAVVAWADGVARHVERRGPGLHVLSERSFGAAASSRDEAVGAALEAVAGPTLVLDRFATVLGTHAADPFAGPCVHAPEWGYGTRSSTLLAWGDTRVLRFADGPPCTTPYVDQSSLLAFDA